MSDCMGRLRYSWINLGSMGFNNGIKSSTEPVLFTRSDTRKGSSTLHNFSSSILSALLKYCTTTTLSAPEVVSLSTLALDPVILIYPPYQSHPTIQQCVWYIFPTPVLKCVP
eukprot:12126057-Ditylum_brightwellii.AAC.1